VLGERGADVTIFEKETFLGGRAGAWTETLEDGTSFEMERGFHAFFRQYYNLRALLRRIDPDLSMLAPVPDYPICGPHGSESFAGLSKTVPLNVAQLALRTETMRWRDLLRVNVRAAMAMLAYDQDEVYRRYDGMSAAGYLDSLRFPPRARRMLFDVFSHSFFNPEEEMSAAELLMMFHFYFTGNPEGLLFDLAKAPFSTALWQPLAKKLEADGVRINMGCPVDAVVRREDGYAACGENFDAVVLALSVEPLKALVANSPTLDDDGFRRQVATLELTRPFAVWRMWLETPVEPGRAPFVGTTGVGILDNISVYELFEDESADWAERAGGSVIELHAYSVPPEMDEAAIKNDLLRGLYALYPETETIAVREERFLLRRDCPAFAPGSWRDRPTVTTGHSDLMLAGDFIKLPIPSALMERAAASGFIAANQILAKRGVRSEPIWSVPRRGIVPPNLLSVPGKARRRSMQ